MSFQASYGGYKFPLNSAAVASRCNYVRSKSGRPQIKLVRADVRATLYGDTVKELSDLEDKVRAALEKPNLDFKFFDGTGFNVSTSILNRNALGIAVVDGPHFLDSMTPEYVTIRTVTFAVEGEYVIKGADAYLVDYQDMIAVIGNGGPSRKWRVPIKGRPIRQVTTEFSIVRGMHQGQAVGLTRYPQAPAPAFGRQYLVNESESVTLLSAEPTMNGFKNFPIAWNYQFEADRVMRSTLRQPRM